MKSTFSCLLTLSYFLSFLLQTPTNPFTDKFSFFPNSENTGLTILRVIEELLYTHFPIEPVPETS